MRKVDKETLDDIENFNKLVYKQYKILANLDILGKKDSQEYKKTIENIKMINEVIRKKFASLNISADDLIDYDDEYLNRNHIYGNEIVLDLITQKEKLFVFERMIMLIYFYSINNDIYSMDDIYSANNIGYRESNEINDYIEDNIRKGFEIDRALEKLFAYTFLQYLNEAITLATDKDVRRLLITTKYNFACVYNNIEDNFLKENDDFTDKVKLYQYILDRYISNDSFKDIDIHVKDIDERLEEYYATLASFDDSYYKSKKNSIIAYVMELLIKTYLSVNISMRIDHKFKVIRRIAVCESEKSRKAVMETGNLDENLTITKKIDL